MSATRKSQQPCEDEDFALALYLQEVENSDKHLNGHPNGGNEQVYRRDRMLTDPDVIHIDSDHDDMSEDIFMQPDDSFVETDRQLAAHIQMQEQRMLFDPMIASHESEMSPFTSSDMSSSSHGLTPTFRPMAPHPQAGLLSHNLHQRVRPSPPQLLFGARPNGFRSGMPRQFQGRRSVPVSQARNSAPNMFGDQMQALAVAQRSLGIGESNGLETYEQLLTLDDNAVRCGLTSDEFDRLTTVSILDEATISRLSTENNQCSICLEEYSTGDEVRWLPCVCRFHKQCIDKHLEQNKKCPICRTEVDAHGDSWPTP